VHRGLLVRVQRLHQIDLDLERPLADGADVFVDVLALAAEGAGHLQAEHVDPEFLQALLVGAADGDLLHAEHAKGAGGNSGHGQGGPYSNSTMGWSTASDSPCWASTLATVPSAV